MRHRLLSRQKTVFAAYEKRRSDFDIAALLLFRDSVPDSWNGFSALVSEEAGVGPKEEEEGEGEGGRLIPGQDILSKSLSSLSPTNGEVATTYVSFPVLK